MEFNWNIPLSFNSVLVFTSILYFVSLAARRTFCPFLPIASDKFTVNTSNGNGALTYPVGLITEDEVAMAGGVDGSSNTNTSYYLYTNQYYWSGSPASSSATEFYVNYNGILDTNLVDREIGARPVVSLSSKAKLSGSGTYSNPYTVSSD